MSIIVVVSVSFAFLSATSIPKPLQKKSIQHAYLPTYYMSLGTPGEDGWLCCILIFSGILFIMTLQDKHVYTANTGQVKAFTNHWH